MAIKLTAINNLIYGIKKLDEDKLLKNIFADKFLQDYILDLNREDQLYDKGITADGISLGEYSPATIQGTSNFEGKIQKGQRYDHITLKDSGKFYESFIFKPYKNYFLITANTLKGGKVLKYNNRWSMKRETTRETDLMDYGNILGLTDENKNEVVLWIKDPLREGIKTQILK